GDEALSAVARVLPVEALHVFDGAACAGGSLQFVACIQPDLAARPHRREREAEELEHRRVVATESESRLQRHHNHRPDVIVSLDAAPAPTQADAPIITFDGELD